MADDCALDDKDSKEASAYIVAQADSLFRQWEFYENLTWRIPTLVLSANGALFYVLEKSKGDYASVAFFIVGAVNVLFGHRLYRSSRMAIHLLDQLTTRFDNKYGLRDVVRSTGALEWASWSRPGSRLLLARAFELWGLGLVLWSFVS